MLIEATITTSTRRRQTEVADGSVRRHVVLICRCSSAFVVADERAAPPVSSIGPHNSCHTLRLQRATHARREGSRLHSPVTCPLVLLISSSWVYISVADVSGRTTEVGTEMLRSNSTISSNITAAISHSTRRFSRLACTLTTRQCRMSISP